jgi:hypothetical protein
MEWKLNERNEVVLEDGSVKPICSRLRMEVDDGPMFVLTNEYMTFCCFPEICANCFRYPDFSMELDGKSSKIAVGCKSRELVFYTDDVDSFDNARLMDEAP